MPKDAHAAMFNETQKAQMQVLSNLLEQAMRLIREKKHDEAISLCQDRILPAAEARELLPSQIGALAMIVRAYEDRQAEGDSLRMVRIQEEIIARTRPAERDVDFLMSYPETLLCLAVTYAKGDAGIPRDIEKSISYFERLQGFCMRRREDYSAAITSVYLDGLLYMYALYMDESCMVINEKKAMRYLSEAIEFSAILFKNHPDTLKELRKTYCSIGHQLLALCSNNFERFSEHQPLIETVCQTIMKLYTLDEPEYGEFCHYLIEWYLRNPRLPIEKIKRELRSIRQAHQSDDQIEKILLSLHAIFSLATLYEEGLHGSEKNFHQAVRRYQEIIGRYEMLLPMIRKHEWLRAIYVQSFFSLAHSQQRGRGGLEQNDIEIRHHYLRAIDLYRSLSTEHAVKLRAHYVGMLGNLAWLYDCMNQPHLGLPLYEEVIQLYESTPKKMISFVMQSEYADTLMRLAAREDAALEKIIYYKTITRLGPELPHYFSANLSLASIYQDSQTDDIAGAISIYKALLRFHIRDIGQNYIHVRINLAKIYLKSETDTFSPNKEAFLLCNEIISAGGREPDFQATTAYVQALLYLACIYQLGCEGVARQIDKTIACCESILALSHYYDIETGYAAKLVLAFVYSSAGSTIEHLEKSLQLYLDIGFYFLDKRALVEAAHVCHRLSSSDPEKASQQWRILWDILSTTFGLTPDAAKYTEDPYQTILSLCRPVDEAEVSPVAELMHRLGLFVKTETHAERPASGSERATTSSSRKRKKPLSLASLSSATPRDAHAAMQVLRKLIKPLREAISGIKTHVQAAKVLAEAHYLQQEAETLRKIAGCLGKTEKTNQATHDALSAASAVLFEIDELAKTAEARLSALKETMPLSRTEVVVASSGGGSGSGGDGDDAAPKEIVVDVADPVREVMPSLWILFNPAESRGLYLSLLDEVGLYSRVFQILLCVNTQMKDTRETIIRSLLERLQMLLRQAALLSLNGEAIIAPIHEFHHEMCLAETQDIGRLFATPFLQYLERCEAAFAAFDLTVLDLELELKQLLRNLASKLVNVHRWRLNTEMKNETRSECGLSEGILIIWISQCIRLLMPERYPACVSSLSDAIISLDSAETLPSLLSAGVPAALGWLQSEYYLERSQLEGIFVGASDAAPAAAGAGLPRESRLSFWLTPPAEGAACAHEEMDGVFRPIK